MQSVSVRTGRYEEEGGDRLMAGKKMMVNMFDALAITYCDTGRLPLLNSSYPLQYNYDT